MTSDNLPNERKRPAVQSDGCVRHTWGEGCRPTVALVEAVAAATDREPTAMPPLYEYVDGDALNALVAGRSSQSAGTIEVSFTYDGIPVRLDSDGGIEIWTESADHR